MQGEINQAARHFLAYLFNLFGVINLPSLRAQAAHGRRSDPIRETLAQFGSKALQTAFLMGAALQKPNQFAILGPLQNRAALGDKVCHQSTIKFLRRRKPLLAKRRIS